MCSGFISIVSDGDTWEHKAHRPLNELNELILCKHMCVCEHTCVVKWLNLWRTYTCLCIFNQCVCVCLHFSGQSSMCFSSVCFCSYMCLCLKAAPSQTSHCLPLINPLITVISDSFHHYSLHTAHCLPAYTTDFLTHTHTKEHTDKHTEAWLLITHSSTFTPAVCHPSLCH